MHGASQGCAVPPVLVADPPRLDFGVVPFGFESMLAFTLTNKSSSPQTLELALSKGVDPGCQGDISINPCQFTLDGGKQQRVGVRLRPSKAQAYRLQIDAGVPGVCSGILGVDVLGSSKTPQVTLTPSNEIRADDIFVSTDNIMTFYIDNTSRLAARYQVDVNVSCF